VDDKINLRIVPMRGTLKERVLGILFAEGTLILKTCRGRQYFADLINHPESRVEVRRIVPTREALVWGDFTIHTADEKKVPLHTKYKLCIGKRRQVIVRFNGELRRTKLEIEKDLQKPKKRNLNIFWRRAPGSFGTRQ
jgi:polyisoprenoid-binding protein YceI